MFFIYIYFFLVENPAIADTSPHPLYWKSPLLYFFLWNHALSGQRNWYKMGPIFIIKINLKKWEDLVSWPKNWQISQISIKFTILLSLGSIVHNLSLTRVNSSLFTLHSSQCLFLLGLNESWKTCSPTKPDQKLVIVQLGPRSKQSLNLQVWTKDEH